MKTIEKHKQVKIEADYLDKITISMFQSGSECYGSFTFNTGLTVNYIFILTEYNQRIDLNYSGISDNEEIIKQHIQLLKTNCNFGGERHWFSCPGIKNGFCCQKRVGTLYFLDGIFACRNCHDLTYSLRNLSYDSIEYSVINFNKLREKMKKINDNIKKKSYRGKRTCKFLRLGRILNKYQNAKSKLLSQIQLMKDNPINI